MAETFLLEIVTPSQKLLSKEVEELTAPGQEGEFGILAGHIPFLSILKAGELSYRKGAETGQIVVGRGYAEVLPEKTTILVDYAQSGSEVDAEGAKEALAKAEEALKTLSVDDPAYGPTMDSYELAQAKIRAKEKQR